MQNDIDRLTLNAAAELLFNYIRDVIYNPGHAFLDMEKLPRDFEELGQGLQYLADCITETRKYSNALSKGDLDVTPPSPSNEIAAPLKSLHASLQHLTWQTEKVAEGDYQQHVDFMGKFSTAFNKMVRQLNERQKIDSDVKTKLQRYVDLLLDNSPDILMLFDINNKLVSVSKSFLTSSKIADSASIINSSITEVLSSVVNENFLLYLDKLLRITVSEKHITELEQEIAFAGGDNLRQYLVRISPIMDEYWIVIGSLISFHDMTAIREADKRTQLMLDSMPLCANIWDKNYDIIDCNQEAVKMFELSNKQEYLDRYHELSPEYQPCGTPSRQRTLELVKTAFETGYYRCEWMHQKLNGEPIPCEITFVRVNFRGGFIVAGYTRDLRELKAMISEMRRIDIAEANNRAKSKFLAMMSHEIRTPMNAIMGITEIVMRDEDIPPRIEEAFGMIYSSSSTLLQIINEVLDLSKIEMGKMELIPAKYEIASLINDIVEQNTIRYSKKPIKFKLVVDEYIPAEIIGDYIRIKQILNNLLSNAFKYTEKGTVELSVGFEDNFEEEKHDGKQYLTLIFCVKDTGQGMTKEQISELFNEYSRFNIEANRSVEGTGLGMNITQHLIQLMNGEITVESEPGAGSAFTVRLRQEKTDSAIIGKELAENLRLMRKNSGTKIKKNQIVHEPMPYGKVLIVDDVYTNLYVAKELMTPYGLSIDIAMSGFEAIDLLKKGYTYDVIFMDHMMPQMDGIETAALIRRMGYKQPIVALTANALKDQAKLFIDNGFNGFISKPIDVRQLDDVLKELIRDKQTQEVLESAKDIVINKKAGDKAGAEALLNPYLAEIFISDANKTILTLDAIFSNKFRRDDDIQMYIITVHAIKSALANIGEKEISDFAFKLEKAGGDYDIDTMRNETPIFLDTLRKLISKIEPMTTKTDGKLIFEDIELLTEKLLTIQSACIVYDKRTAKEALGIIKAKKWKPSTEKMLSSIAEYILHSEFEKAAEAAENLILSLPS